jgi:uncharacterized membrane protein YphA (DoxX/SURF4 family)
VRRFFGIFPRGWQGAALFVMRCVVGLALLVQGKYYLFEPASGAAWTLGLVAGLAGILLMLGFLTPLICLAVTLGSLGVLFSLLPASSPTLFDSAASDAFVLTIVLGLLALGPGAASVDARVFGRREVIFPPPDFDPKDRL